MKRRPLAAGERVFFKRRGWRLMRSYWCHRWDNLELREVLSRTYEPKYRVEREALSGYFIKLERLDFLWYRGLFSVGTHVASGRYVRVPIDLPVFGFGPREVVFPTRITAQLDRIVLIGGWRRYQLGAGLGLDEIDHRRARPGDERLALRVDRFDFVVPPPLLTRWGPSQPGRTLCLVGVVANTRLVGRTVIVPLREISWRDLAGYRERYLAG